MDSAAVDAFFPKAAAALPYNLIAPRADAQSRAAQPASFDRCLQAATRNSSQPAERRLEPREQPDRPASQPNPSARPGRPTAADASRPKDQKEKADGKPDSSSNDTGSAQRAADRDADRAEDRSEDRDAEAAPAVQAAVAAAQPGLIELGIEFGDSQADLGQFAVEVTDPGKTGANAATPAQAFQTEAQAAQALPAKEQAAAQFAAQAAQALPAKEQAAAAAADDASAQPPDLTDTAASDSQKLTIEDAGDQPDSEDTNLKISVKREPAEPVNPAPPAPESPQSSGPNVIALHPGQQMRVEARSAQGQAPAAPAAARAPIADTQVLDQMVRGASMMVSQGRSEIRVHLHPPELGSVRLHLVSDRNNVVDARIVTERDDVRQLVERNLTQLRDALAGSGIDVGTFDVSTRNPGNAWDSPNNSDGNTFAWDANEPGGAAATEPSGSLRGVNRSAGENEIDYII